MESYILPLPGVTNIICVTRDEIAAFCEVEKVLASCDVLHSASKGLSAAGALAAFRHDGTIVVRRFQRLEKTAGGETRVFVENGKEVHVLSSVLAQELSDEDWHVATSDMAQRMLQGAAARITLLELRDVCRKLTRLHHCALVLERDARQHGAMQGSSCDNCRYRFGYVTDGDLGSGPGDVGRASFGPRAVAERCRDDLLVELHAPPVPDDAQWEEWCAALRHFVWSQAAAEQVAAHGRLIEWPLSQQQQQHEEEPRPQLQQQPQREQQLQEVWGEGAPVDAVCHLAWGLSGLPEQQGGPACEVAVSQPERSHSERKLSPLPTDPRRQHVSTRPDEGASHSQHPGQQHGSVQAVSTAKAASPCSSVKREPVPEQEPVPEREWEHDPVLVPGPEPSGPSKGFHKRSRSRSRSPGAVRGASASRGGGSGLGTLFRQGRGQSHVGRDEAERMGGALSGTAPPAGGKAYDGSKDEGREPLSVEVWSRRVHEFLLAEPDGQATADSLMSAGLGIPPEELRRSRKKVSTFLYGFSHLWTVMARHESKPLILVAVKPRHTDGAPGPNQKREGRRRVDEDQQKDVYDGMDRGKRQRRCGQEAFDHPGAEMLSGFEEAVTEPPQGRQPASVPSRQAEVDQRTRPPLPRSPHEQRSGLAQQHELQPPPGRREARDQSYSSQERRVATEGQQQSRDVRVQGRDWPREQEQPPVRGPEATRERERGRPYEVRTYQQARSDVRQRAGGGGDRPRGRVAAAPQFESKEEERFVARLVRVLQRHPKGMALSDLARAGYAIPVGVLKGRKAAVWAKRHASLWEVSVTAPVVLTLRPDRGGWARD